MSYKFVSSNKFEVQVQPNPYLQPRYINDIPYINTFYATVGGVHLKDLNRLEITLLNALMWRLDVSPEEFDRKQEDMRRALADEFSASDATSSGLFNRPRGEGGSEAGRQPNLGGLVAGCIDADFCNQIFV